MARGCGISPSLENTAAGIGAVWVGIIGSKEMLHPSVPLPFYRVILLCLTNCCLSQDPLWAHTPSSPITRSIKIPQLNEPATDLIDFPHFTNTTYVPGLARGVCHPMAPVKPNTPTRRSLS